MTEERCSECGLIGPNHRAGCSLKDVKPVEEKKPAKKAAKKSKK